MHFGSFIQLNGDKMFVTFIRDAHTFAVLLLSIAMSLENYATR